jgi:actin-related protein
MEKIWTHILCEEMGIDPKEHPILMSEEIGNDNETREKNTLIMFESFEIPGFFLEQTSLFNLFYSGRTTGTVLNMGYSKNDTCCIFDGKILPKAEISHFGGKELSEQTRNRLFPYNSNCDPHDDQNVYDHIKERKCFVSLNLYNQKPKEVLFETPTGETINVGKESYLIPEILFDPSVINNELSIQEIISNCIQSKNEDLKDLMYSNIVLGGSGSLFKGLKERLEFELSSYHTKEINVIPGNQHSQWIGASMLSKLSSFQREWITKEMYDEVGPRIVRSFCFNNVEYNHCIRKPNNLSKNIFNLLKKSKSTDIHFQ